MKRRKTDPRHLRAKREAALARPELLHRRDRPSAETRRLIDEAIAAGRVTRCPPSGKGGSR